MKHGRKVVGTCSICRGPVIEEFGLQGKIIRCANCGATKLEDYGPIIEMSQPKTGDMTWGAMYETK